jgi:hypothetical protein
MSKILSYEEFCEQKTDMNVVGEGTLYRVHEANLIIETLEGSLIRAKNICHKMIKKYDGEDIAVSAKLALKHLDATSTAVNDMFDDVKGLETSTI